MGSTAIDIADALNSYFISVGANFLRFIGTSTGLTLAYKGVGSAGMLGVTAVTDYNDFISQGYSSSAAIAKVGSEIIVGLSAATLADDPAASPWIAAGIDTFSTLAGEKFGGALYDFDTWLNGQTYSLIQNLQSDLSNFFASPASSNILLSNLTAPTGFTTTPTPGGLAGTYDATTSQSIASWQFTQVTAAAVQQAESTGVYVVQAGNTLSDIANKFGTTMEALMKANPDITKANMIYAGQQITLPTSTNTTTSLDPATYQFVNGNLVSYSDSTGATTKYGYDSNNNLTSVTES